MTREEVLAMPAGREMDEAVASLFEPRPTPTADADWVLNQELSGDPLTSATGAWQERCLYQEGDVPKWIPAPFSENISYAWKVAKRFGLAVVHSEDGVYAGKPEDIEHGHVRGTSVPTLTLHMREHERWEPADTAPLAICRAALLAGVSPSPTTEEEGGENG